VTLRYGPRATTYLLVRQPKGGDWTVSVDGGSSTVIGISTANAVPDPDVSARVTGGSASRVLRFRARRIPGQRIVFTEVARGIDRPIGATERSSGRIRFTPSEGAAGPRLVAAEVEQDGMPRTSIAVARFRTSGVVRPGSVGRVRARRKGSRAVFTWGRAKRAASYDVSVSVTDGRRVRLTRTSRRVVVGRLFRADRVKVVVRARTRSGRLGAARSAQVGRRR
jgi:hypothetical protein